jgi:hypothetical protein
MTSRILLRPSVLFLLCLFTVYGLGCIRTSGGKTVRIQRNRFGDENKRSTSAHGWTMEAWTGELYDVSFGVDVGIRLIEPENDAMREGETARLEFVLTQAGEHRPLQSVTRETVFYQQPGMPKEWVAVVKDVFPPLEEGDYLLCVTLRSEKLRDLAVTDIRFQVRCGRR